VNIARALKCLDEPVIATGFAAGPTGSRIRELLDAEQVLHDFVEVAGDSRTNLAVVDPTSGEQTEINERGPQITPGDLERFSERLMYLAGGAQLCVIAGSLPPGAEPDYYGALVSAVRAAGVPTLLDVDGEPMRAGLRAQPSIVAPNVTEAEEAVGYEFTDAEDLATALGDLIEMGADEAIITTANGCVALVGKGPAKQVLEVAIDPLAAIASVGSGDAFVAGFVAARRAGRAIEDCLTYGVACGAESTQHLGAGALDRPEVERLVDGVRVERLDAPLRTA
jgi:1-phosphofructokinase family hexose kinase